MKLSIFWLMNWEWKLNDPTITPEKVLEYDMETIVKEVTPKQEFFNMEKLEMLKCVPFVERGRTVIKFTLKEEGEN